MNYLSGPGPCRMIVHSPSKCEPYSLPIDEGPDTPFRCTALEAVKEAL